MASFFALVAVVLEQGFQKSAELALRDKLQVQIYSILSAAEMDKNGNIKMPEALPEPRFSSPGSGLYAFIQRINEHQIWRSPSAVGLYLPLITGIGPGQFLFSFDENGRYQLHYDVIWESENGLEQEYIFSVIENDQFVTHQVEHFRTTLRSWLLMIAIVLMVVQFAVLRWGLKPLRIIVKDLEAIEQGKKNRLEGYYPTELQGFAGNLNALIKSERAHLERYRNTLADLAHSLKTPLAILRGCVESTDINKKTVQDQISRMDEIVDYQLQRAAAKGNKKFTGKVDVVLIIQKIIKSVEKVYVDKDIHIELNLPKQCYMYCEEGDVFEIAGNIIDNACKWCDHRIAINLEPLPENNAPMFSLLLQVEDDGPGIPESKLHEILQRGVRADENIHGHGIGMAVVHELIELMDGELKGGKSVDLGGMQWRVYLP